MARTPTRLACSEQDIAAAIRSYYAVEEVQPAPAAFLTDYEENFYGMKFVRRHLPKRARFWGSGAFSKTFMLPNNTHVVKVTTDGRGVKLALRLARAYPRCPHFARDVKLLHVMDGLQPLYFLHLEALGWTGEYKDAPAWLHALSAECVSAPITRFSPGTIATAPASVQEALRTLQVEISSIQGAVFDIAPWNTLMRGDEFVFNDPIQPMEWR